MSISTIRLKRSFTQGSEPTLDQLTTGELAINHYDGTVFVRQDTQGVGIATRVVQVGAGKSIGRTFFVTTQGDDNNLGLTQADALATVKKAAEFAQPGDTIKVAAGIYTENNPIVLRDNVSVEGFELRNCYIAPNNPGDDLFHINNACHLTDLAFIGKGADIGGGSKGVPEGGSEPGFLGVPMTSGSAVVAFVPLLGVAGDRYFDGARMIRQNADYIAGEAVGFLTSGFSGVAGSHRAQDAARLIDLNADYIAAEAVGFITSVNYAGGGFTMSFGTARDCQDDIKDVIEAVAHDLRAGYRDGVRANSKSVGAAQSYFVGGALSHILGAGVSEATIAAMDRAAGIATFVINNKPYAFENVGSGVTVTAFNYTPSTGVATVTTLIGHGLTTTDHVTFSGLAFTCASEHSGVTTTIFPDGSSPSGFNFKIDADGLFNTTQFVINVGISTIDHIYTASSGTAITTYQYSTLEQQFDTGAAAGTNIRGENVVGNGICLNVNNDITELVGIVTDAIGAGNTDSLPGITTGIRLEMNKCRRDVAKILKSVCYDITRGGNTKVIGAAKSYYDENGNKLDSLVDPDEFDQSVIALEYSKDICRRIINNVRDGSYTIGTAFNISAGDYTPSSGIITVTTTVGHGLTDKDTVKLAGLGFTCAAHNNVISITNFEYDKASGFSTITLASDHGISSGDEFEMFDIAFTCPGGSGVTTTIFPDGTTGDYIFDAYVGTAGTVIYTNVGISTIDHTYDTGGEVRVGVTTTVFPDGTFGDYFEVKDYVSDTQVAINVGISTFAHTYQSGGTIQKTRTFRPDIGQIRDVSIQNDPDTGNNNTVGNCKNVISAVNTAIGVCTAIIEDGFRTLQDPLYLTPTNATYDPVGGALTVTVADHGLTTTDKVKLAPNSINFTCGSDGNITTIGYPDKTSPIYDKFVGISQTTTNTFTLNLGSILNENKIVPSDGAANDNFGLYAAIGSGKIVVGSHNDDDDGNASGSAYIYNLDGTNEIKITASDAAADDQFGSAVAVGNNKVVVGARFNSDDGASSGSAYIYNLDGTNEIKITASDAAADDKFGWPVAIGNNKIVIGATGAAGDAGAVYVYDLDGTNEVKITASDGAAFDDFGAAIAIGENKIIIGAQRDDDAGSSSGSAYIYNLDGTGEIKITASDAASGDQFGNAVAIGDGKIAVGAYLDGDGNETGAVYVYDLDGTNEVKITGSIGDRVGAQVAITNRRIITSRFGIDPTPILVYRLDGTDEAVIESSATSGINFGSSIVADNGTFLVGAWRDNDAANNAGAVYSFSLNGALNHTFVSAATSAINYGGAGISTRFPGNNGAGSDFENDPTFSPGTDGPVLKGPYIRNCTNFIENSIGMRINGFDADPGDKDELGVQGSMSVDSFTQYNQGGIGVSITNGAYAQLVSIFTICCNEAIVTLSGGQCDLTNSNSSFGEFGLVSKGVGDETSSSNYRQTAEVVKPGNPGRTVEQGVYDIGDKKVVLTGVGTQRPYDGQTLFFDELYFSVEKVKITNGGSGYEGAVPSVTFTDPTGPDGITAQGIPIIEDGVVTDFLVANSGTQYQENSFPSITIGAPPSGGIQATAEVERMQPLYFKVASATLPHNGISTITMSQGLNNDLAGGEIAYITRQSLQITSSHSFEYVGSGNTILTARPSVGGIIIQDNEVVQEDGGLVVYTSTDQAGNFRIGDGIQIDQATGTISGRVYIKSLFNSVTPFILALGG